MQRFDEVTFASANRAWVSPQKGARFSGQPAKAAKREIRRRDRQSRARPAVGAAQRSTFLIRSGPASADRSPPIPGRPR